ncbi:BRCT domain-containing protein [Litoribacter populi]|uniref:BRCT domain-containing protein n=1 Tax=Litoribacter populi TaxID=2598460 RepID=UPI00117D74F9|nr:BRCT domain-containing protein [Litoribacter populi]
MTIHLNNQLVRRALELSLLFSDESSIPECYRSFNAGMKPIHGDSEQLREAFVDQVNTWEKTIFSLINSDFDVCRIEPVLYLTPPNSAPCCEDTEDFNYFMEYIEHRRFVEHCSEREYENLINLAQEYCSVHERNMNNHPRLKNPLAQELMDTGEIELNGHQIIFWRGHTRDSVLIQQDWNRIESFAALNANTINILGRVVFSGVFQIRRTEMAAYASQMGFRIQATVNGKTNLLVYGSENVGPEKIASFLKQKKKRDDIQLMSENEFLEMVLDNCLL